jgi:hypothetical protein
MLNKLLYGQIQPTGAAEIEETPTKSTPHNSTVYRKLTKSVVPMQQEQSLQLVRCRLVVRLLGSHTTKYQLRKFYGAKPQTGRIISSQQVISRFSAEACNITNSNSCIAPKISLVLHRVKTFNGLITPGCIHHFSVAINRLSEKHAFLDYRVHEPVIMRGVLLQSCILVSTA